MQKGLSKQTLFASGISILITRFSTIYHDPETAPNLMEHSMTLTTGQFAPDICLDSHLGHPIRISDFRHQKNVVLAFFPLAWTPV